MVGLHILSVARHLTNERPAPRTFTVAASWLLYKCLPRSHSLIPRHSINNSELKCSQHWAEQRGKFVRNSQVTCDSLGPETGFCEERLIAQILRSYIWEETIKIQNTLVMTIWFARITELSDWWKTAFNQINQDKKCHEIQQSQQQSDYRTWNENWFQ